MEYTPTLGPNFTTKIPSSLRSKSGASSLDTEDLFRVFVSVILIPIIVFGNLLVMAAYKTNRRLRTGTYTLLVSLAFCDFLVGSVSVPLWLYTSLSNWRLGKFLNLFFMGFDYLTALSSSMHLTVICVERWLAISKPFLHQVFRNEQYYAAIGLVWFVALTLSSLVFIPEVIHPGRIYILMLVIFGFVAPFIAISLVNAYIFRVAQKLIHQEPMASTDSAEIEQRNKIQKERRMAKTLVIITALFFFELLPTYILALLGGFCLTPCLTSMGWKGIKRVMNFAKWMQYSNSGINPFVYAFRDAEMRKTFKRLFTRTVLFRRTHTVANMSQTERQSAQSEAHLWAKRATKESCVSDESYSSYGNIPYWKQIVWLKCYSKSYTAGFYSQSCCDTCSMKLYFSEKASQCVQNG